jgi:hypothetical protein
VAVSIRSLIPSIYVTQGLPSFLVMPAARAVIVVDEASMVAIPELRRLPEARRLPLPADSSHE